MLHLQLSHLLHIVAYFSIYGFSVFLLFKYWNRLFVAILSAFFLFAGFSLTGIFLISNYFTGNGIDESVVFHLAAGVDGVPRDILLYLYTIFGGYVLVSLAVCVLLVFKFRAAKDVGFDGRALFSLVFISLSFLVHPATSDIYWLAKPGVNGNLAIDIGSSERPRNYIPLAVPPKFTGDAKPNIIYLYLESLERSFLDEKVFPGLTPNLNEMKKRALDFTNIKQAYATGWTIAGMVASQCGSPLITPVGINRTDGLSGFLPELVCLGNILKEQDYHLGYMGGADLKFANKGMFFKEHGFHEVIGRQSLSKGLREPDYLSRWGVFDDTLYEALEKKVEDLMARDQPFALFALTLDTHAPEGFPSQKCSQVKYKDGRNPMLNVVHCADKLVAGFVESLNRSGALNNTILVISSDHLAMHNTASDILAKMDRRNLLLMFPPSGRSEIIEREGTTMDVAPTLLSLQGTSTSIMGFGRNILDEEVLVPQNIDLTISSHKAFFMRQWAFDQMESGITVIPSQNIIKFSEDRLASLPILITFNDFGDVDRVYFEGMNTPSLLKELERFSRKKASTIIDKCSKLTLMPIEKKDMWCMVRRNSLGDMRFEVISDYKKLERSQLVLEL